MSVVMQLGELLHRCRIPTNCAIQTGPTHGFHQCGIKPTGLDSVSPYISSLALYTLETSLCLYTALLLVELTLT